MDFINSLSSELKALTLASLIAGTIVAIAKGLFIAKIKQLWGHLKKKQKAYWMLIGAFSAFLLFYFMLTMHNKVKLVQDKFNKYESLSNAVSKGTVVMKFLDFSRLLKENAKRDFRALNDQNIDVEFLNHSKWKKTHLTNIYGIISVDREKEEVYFVYKAIHGKNKNSDEALSTNSYNKDNPRLFLKPLVLQGKDKEAFLGDPPTVNKCLERPLKKDLAEMQKKFDAKEYKYETCDFRASFFYTTGRWRNSNGEYHGQKTFNEINHIYYIIVPIASEGKSSLYLYYAFNSGNEYFLDQPVQSYLYNFLAEVNRYKKEIKKYENLNESN